MAKPTNEERARKLREKIRSNQNGHHDSSAPADQPSDQPALIIEPTPWPAPPHADAFHGLAGDIVRRIDPETEADPVAVLLQFLVAFGNAVGRNPHCYVGASRHFTNLYACLVGRTAKSRKGTSWAWVRRLFEGADAPWTADRLMGGLSSGEGLISAVRDQRRGRSKDDADAILDDGVSDKRLLALEEEFASVLRMASREGNILSAVMRQGWDTGHLRTLTRANPLRATNAHISILGHITREELARALSETDMANGLANRFLWIAARRSKLLPDGGLQLDLSDLIQRLRQRLVWASTVGKMTRDAVAARLWRDEYPRLTAERAGALGLVTNRSEAQVLRLSMTYAVLDGQTTVQEEHLKAALALWAYCERSCAWVFGEGTGSADADTILVAMKQAGEKGLSIREVSALFGRHKTAQQIKRALVSLLDSGVARPEKTPTAGRPADRWFFVGTCEQSEQSEQSYPATT
ncbi:MAG: hypothetical protein V4597_11480 [Pseudomonadota bacterium]